MINFLLKVEKYTDNSFVVVKNKIVKRISTNEEISHKLLLYGIPPSLDGIYLLTKNTCDDPQCAIGRPKQKCIDLNVYSKGKCAVYGFYPIRKFSLNIKILTKILQLKPIN